MIELRGLGFRLIVSAFIALLTLASPGLAQQTTPASSPAGAGAALPDGQHDFDFEIGTWKTKLSRLVAPLSGSTKWVEYEGTSVVRPVWGGRANLVELDVQGPAGRIEGASLRLYNPTSRQWSLNFASVRSGVMTPPVVGGFENGRGEFYGTDTVDDGRVILVRFVISKVTADSWRFEQAFSADGGKTWDCLLYTSPSPRDS